tara:strand:- start:473 stop:718 length:246 start_codon:yes stop_codon:yes gene_type:complete
VSEPTTPQDLKNGGDAFLEVLAPYDIDYPFTSSIAALAPLWEAFAKRRRTHPEFSRQTLKLNIESISVNRKGVFSKMVYIA